MFKRKNTCSQTTLETLKKVRVMFKANNKDSKTALMKMLYCQLFDFWLESK